MLKSHNKKYNDISEIYVKINKKTSDKISNIDKRIW